MADEEIEEGGGGGKGKLIMILVVVLLLLAGIGVGAFMFLGGDEEETNAKPADAAAQARLEEEIAATSADEVTKLENPLFTPPRKYTVNLRDGKHFLSIKLVAALEDPMALAFLAQREYLVDDKVISFLQNLTTDELRARGGTDMVKRELYKQVNSIFTQDFIENSETKDRTPVKKILITEFILN